MALSAWPLLVIGGWLLFQAGRHRRDPWLRAGGRLGVHGGLCAAAWWAYGAGGGQGLLTLLMALTLGVITLGVGHWLLTFPGEGPPARETDKEGRERR